MKKCIYCFLLILAGCGGGGGDGGDGTTNAPLIGVADLRVGGVITGEAASSGDVWIRFQNPEFTDVFVTSVIDGDTDIALIVESGSDFDAAVSRLTDGVDNIVFACGGKFGTTQFGCTGFGEGFFFGASGWNGIDFAGFEISKIVLEINNVEVRFDSDQDVTFISAELRLSIFGTNTCGAGGGDCAVPIAAQADVFIPGAPAAVDEFSPLTLSVDFGIQFLSIDSICFTSTFAGDLWDSGESYTILSPVALNIGGHGQINGADLSKSQGFVCIQPASGEPASLWGAELLDGRLDDFRFTVEAGSTVSLSALRIEIDGSVFAKPTTVVIDIKLSSDPNSINPRSKDEVTVAILSTNMASDESIDFDAIQVDSTTVTFGPDRAGIAHSDGHVKDVDADGDYDFILHFNMWETGIACGDTEATLNGETYAGEAITSTDSVNTVGCDAVGVMGDP